MSTVSIDSLEKEFRVPGGVEVAINGINLEMQDGEFITIVGPSGCGKTTTLRCVAGLETPTSGEIAIDGEDITDFPPNKRNIAMMFQNIALYPHMTLRDNISYPLKIRNVPRSERDEEARKVAKIMQIEELLDKYPSEVSGGQQQRAGLARTVVQDPRLFLMDEPLSDLDARLKVEMRKEIQRTHKRLGKPTLYVTHDQEEALTMSDRIVIMNNGRIEQIGTPSDVYTDPVNQFVAEFIGSPSMNFMRARIRERSDKRVQIEWQNTTVDISIDYLRQEPSSSDIVVGFRPETVTLDVDEGYFTGELVLMERISEMLLATVDGPDGEITATIPEDTPLTEDESVYISFDTHRAHLFDAETGVHLARGDAF